MHQSTGTEWFTPEIAPSTRQFFSGPCFIVLPQNCIPRKKPLNSPLHKIQHGSMPLVSPLSVWFILNYPMGCAKAPGFQINTENVFIVAAFWGGTKK